MAGNKEKKMSKEPERERQKSEDAVYTAEEFAEAGRDMFGNVRRECIVASFRAAGRTSATVKEAQKLVTDFCKKEVQ